MKQVKRTWLALQLAYHWSRILRLRRRGDRLLQAGAPLSSPQLLALSRKAAPHGVAIFLLEQQYKQLEALCGVFFFLGKVCPFSLFLPRAVFALLAFFA